MSLTGNDETLPLFRLKWEQYACFKKSKCCGQDCKGCCYTPRYTQGATAVDADVANQVRFIRSEFSPSIHFREQIDPNLQTNICKDLREKKGTIKLWDTYFGTNVR